MKTKQLNSRYAVAAVCVAGGLLLRRCPLMAQNARIAVCPG